MITIPCYVLISANMAKYNTAQMHLINTYSVDRTFNCSKYNTSIHFIF